MWSTCPVTFVNIWGMCECLEGVGFTRISWFCPLLKGECVVVKGVSLGDYILWVGERVRSMKSSSLGAMPIDAPISKRSITP